MHCVRFTSAVKLLAILIVLDYGIPSLMDDYTARI